VRHRGEPQKGGDNVIKEARNKKGLSQQALGELVGYKGLTAQVMVCLWEKGVRKVPRSKIITVSKVLDIPADRLIQ